MADDQISPNCGQFRRTARTINAMPASTTNTVTVSATYEPTNERSFHVGVRRSANHRATSGRRGRGSDRRRIRHQRSQRERARGKDEEAEDRNADASPRADARGDCPRAAFPTCVHAEGFTGTDLGKHRCTRRQRASRRRPARHPCAARARTAARRACSVSRCAATPGSTPPRRAARTWSRTSSSEHTRSATSRCRRASIPSTETGLLLTLGLVVLVVGGVVLGGLALLVRTNSSLLRVDQSSRPGASST